MHRAAATTVNVGAWMRAAAVSRMQADRSGTGSMQTTFSFGKQTLAVTP